MAIEGVEFKTNVNVGYDISAKELIERFDAVILAGGSEKPRDIQIPGRELNGIYFAMDYLTRQNKLNAGDNIVDQINAENKKVIILGGGDTGSDCVGTANRQKASSITQLEIMHVPPELRPDSTPWPYWPLILRTSSSHEEGVIRKWSINTKMFKGNSNGEVTSLICNEVKLQDGKFVEVPGTEIEMEADLVLIAAGFLYPERNGLIDELVEMGMELDQKGNIKALFGDDENAHATTLSKVFACGDMRRGQSIVVWAIAEGRKCAAAVHRYFSEFAE
jgi:glutamate synthase (NADPH/NADH) small chain